MFVDLEKQTSETKTFPDYKKYLGGLGLGLKILEQYGDVDPLVFAVGPLTGFFPYASKTAVVMEEDGTIEDIYVGGHLATRLKFSDIDALVLIGKAKKEVSLDILNGEVTFYENCVELGTLGLPGKRSTVQAIDKSLIIDYYFGEPGSLIAKKLVQKKVRDIVITGTSTFTPVFMEKYTEIFKILLDKTKRLSVEKAFFPSCSGCPMGCEKSKLGEIGGNVLLHSLVACGYAETIFTDVGTIFSCLNSLGYDYTHEDIEAVPTLIQNLLKELK